jgi:peptidoglycan/LPS O-acetylase OafA/YrhL
MVRRLLLLNGLAILGVILFHATGWGFTALFAWHARYAEAGADFQPVGSASYYGLRAVEQVVAPSLPAFLFVSGFFIAVAAGRSRTSMGWGIAGHRVKNLMKPYLLWSLGLFGLAFLEGKGGSPAGYLTALLTGGANPAYYYVILLSQLYLLSPVLIGPARKRWVLLLVISGFVQLLVQVLQYPVLLGLNSPEFQPFVDRVPKWFFPARMFWFCFGIVAGFHLEKIKAFAVRRRRLLLATAIISVMAGVFEWELYVRLSGMSWLNHRETLIDNLYAFSTILCFIGFTDLRFPFPNQLGDLGAKSFGIYLAHSPVMEYTARTVYHLVPALLAYQIVLQPVVIVLGLAIPLIAMALMRRSPARNLFPYVFG